MCCFVDRVFSFFARGRKNKINSPQTAPPYQRSTNPVNPFFVIILIFIYRINVSICVFHTCIQRLTVWGVAVKEDILG
jgi:hypothetical protein